MAPTHSTSHLSVTLFFTLFLLAQSKLNLDPSDQIALSTIQVDLGIQASESPCDTAGIFCERRISTLKITRLVFKSIRLKGRLSPAIGSLSELRELTLRNNQLVGEIPPQLANCTKLEILNLRNNRFSGEFPVELTSLNRLKVLVLSGNKFSGNLTFLKNFPRLEKLSLADNMFSGEIPSYLKHFVNLKSVNFSGNSLIKEDYSNPGIPKRYILAENATNSAVSPSASKGLNVGPAHKRKDKKKEVGEWILIFIAGIFAGSICGLIFAVLSKLLVYFVKGGKKDASLAIFSPLIKKAEDLAFLDQENGLASCDIIGRGGCGEVYKAQLSNGKWVAIKKVIELPRDASEMENEETRFMNRKIRQIKSEIQTVGHIRHRNLIPLLAHMPRQNCHYLVYEYMKNGSLQDILAQVSEGRREFDWPARHRTAVGIAAGLEYLHMNHTPRIIHRDLKPANVLLDDDMEARITDFGLAKAMPEMHTHVTASNVAGTVGYIAPEYHQTLKFTDKCDIYSFGVLLGVLVIGKLPSDDFFQDTFEMSLVNWLRNVMTSDDPRSAIDPTLLGNEYEEQMLLVLKIACFCTLENPKERPNSKDVRLMLSQIKN